MSSWRDLVSQFSQQIAQQSQRHSPIVQNLRGIIDRSRSLGQKKEDLATVEASKTRLMGRETAFKQYPELAAEAGGVELPEGLKSLRERTTGTIGSIDNKRIYDLAYQRALDKKNSPEALQELYGANAAFIGPEQLLKPTEEEVQVEFEEAKNIMLRGEMGELQNELDEYFEGF